MSWHEEDTPDFAHTEPMVRCRSCAQWVPEAKALGIPEQDRTLWFCETCVEG